MNGPQPPIDPDGLVVADADDLPGRRPERRLHCGRTTGHRRAVDDTEVDAPVEGRPLTDAEIGG